MRLNSKGKSVSEGRGQNITAKVRVLVKGEWREETKLHSQGKSVCEEGGDEISLLR